MGDWIGVTLPLATIKGTVSRYLTFSGGLVGDWIGVTLPPATKRFLLKGRCHVT